MMHKLVATVMCCESSQVWQQQPTNCHFLPSTKVTSVHNCITHTLEISLVFFGRVRAHAICLSFKIQQQL